MTDKKKNNNKKNVIKPSYVAGGIIYLIFCYFLIQYSGYQELYPKKDIVEVFNITMEEMPTDPLGFIVPNTTGVMYILIFTLIFGLIIAYIWTVNKRDEHANPKMTGGTAKWIKDDQLANKWDKHYSDPPNSIEHDGHKNMVLTQNVFMSMDTRQTRRNNNVLVIGGSGAGKSRFFVKPNLCEMPLNCNFICTDPSGELLGDMGNLLEDAGFKIKVFNLVNMKESDRYNPMNYIHTETDVILLVDCILANTTDPNKKGGDDFWEKAQKLMFQAFIFLVWLHGDELHLPKNLSSIVSLMDNCQISEDDSSQDMNLTDKYFAAVKDQGWYFDADGKFQLGTCPPQYADKWEHYDPVGSDICDKQYTKFKMGAGKTLKSILISAMARLSTLDSKDVSDLLADDDIELNKIGDEKTALFVIIPQEHESFNFLAAMLYTQLFQSLYFHAENECRGNYIVVDSNGENVKIFDIPREQEEDSDIDEDSLEEQEIDFKFAKQDETNDNEKKEPKKRKSLFTKNVKQPHIDESKLDAAAEKSTSINTNKAEGDELDQQFHDVTVNNSFNQIDKEKEKEIEEEAKQTDADNESTEDAAKSVKEEAEAFAERAKKAHCVKKGEYYYIKVPAASGKKEDEEIVGKYKHPDFAKKKLKALLDGCRVTVCGLKLPYHVRFLLDEFANIGQIPDFTKKLATMRKYEISSTVILQNLAQIKNMYKDDWGSIMGNCDSFLFLGCPEMDTLKYVSEMLGKETIIVRDHSTSKGGKGSSSLSYKTQGRELATADELRRMKDSECIFVLRGEQPYRGLKHQYVNHPNYKYTADADEHNVYHFKKKKVKPIMMSSLGTTTSSMNIAGSQAAALERAHDYAEWRNESKMENAEEIFNTKLTISDLSMATALREVVEDKIIDEEEAKTILAEVPDYIAQEFFENDTNDNTDNKKNNTSGGENGPINNSNNPFNKSSSSNKKTEVLEDSDDKSWAGRFSS